MNAPAALDDIDPAALDAFIARWAEAQAAELANAQPILEDPACDRYLGGFNFWHTTYAERGRISSSVVDHCIDIRAYETLSHR